MSDRVDVDERFDVLVIGGGVAGLVAALEAASSGARVALVEAHHAGGRAKTSAHHGFSFNQGPHALYAGGALAAACRRFGVSLPGGPPALDRAGVWTGERVAPLPISPAAVLGSRLLSTRAKLAARRVMAALDHEDPAGFTSVSLRELLDDRGAPPDLSAFIEMMTRLSTYAHAPELVSADAVIRQYRLARRGVIYLDHGWQWIIDGLLAALRAAGGVVLEQRPVTAVVRDGAGWAADGPGGRPVVANAVVVAAGLPREVARLTGVDLSPVAGPAVRASCLDLGLARPADVPLLLGMHEPSYLSTHAPPARLAPPGHVVVHVARYLHPDERPDRVAGEAALWAHAARAGIDPEAAVAHRYLHEMTVSGGLPLAARGGLAGRPGIDALGAPGLFLAGDWVGTRGLIADAAAASGATAGSAAAGWSRQRRAA